MSKHFLQLNFTITLQKILLFYYYKVEIGLIIYTNSAFFLSNPTAPGCTLGHANPFAYTIPCKTCHFKNTLGETNKD